MNDLDKKPDETNIYKREKFVVKPNGHVNKEDNRWKGMRNWNILTLKRDSIQLSKHMRHIYISKHKNICACEQLE